MNEDEFKGATRSIAGKVEKAAGDVVGSRDWQVDGVVDQVAGGVQHSYGHAKAIIEDIVDGAPALIDEGRERLKAAGERAGDAVQRGSQRASEAVGETSLIWLAAAVIGSVALGWLINARNR